MPNQPDQRTVRLIAARRHLLTQAVGGLAAHTMDDDYHTGTREIEGDTQPALWVFDCHWEHVEGPSMVHIVSASLYSIDSAGKIINRSDEPFVHSGRTADHLAGVVSDRAEAEDLEMRIAYRDARRIE